MWPFKKKERDIATSGERLKAQIGEIEKRTYTHRINALEAKLNAVCVHLGVYLRENRGYKVVEKDKDRGLAGAEQTSVDR